MMTTVMMALTKMRTTAVPIKPRRQSSLWWSSSLVVQYWIDLQERLQEWMTRKQNAELQNFYSL
jgi:hypothetical protein